MTSVGFDMLDSTDYVEAVKRLRPDIVLGLGDIVIGQQSSQKRMEKMSDRTQEWLKELISGIDDDHEGSLRTALFAPILPIEPEQQRYYLSDLQVELRGNISGLVLYESSSILTIPPGLSNLPRLLIKVPASPSEILDNIALGIDMFTVPFIGEATDAGIALDFSFPCQYLDKNQGILPLGIDMWSSTYTVDLSSLRKNCQCYACINHHKAYVQHLLGAKEMLGWVLLQLHNHHVMDEFFAGVRLCLKDGSFNHQRMLFAKIHETELPEKTGQGPRYV